MGVSANRPSRKRWSRPSPSRTGSRGRRSAAGTRRSRRRRRRRSRRSRQGLPARACEAVERARCRPSNARPRTGGRGTAVSRRRSRSSARTTSPRHGRHAARGGSSPARRRSSGRRSRLERRQRLERADRELGPQQHGLEARDDRVAAEHGHEPGHSRRGQVPGPLAGPQPEGRQVGNGLAERVTEVVRRGRETRQPERPGVECLPDAGALRAEPVLDLLGVLYLAVERDGDVDAHVPRRVGAECHRKANDSGAAARRA